MDQLLYHPFYLFINWKADYKKKEEKGKAEI